MNYAEFLESKFVTAPASGFKVTGQSIKAKLFPFQRDIVKWALERGKAGIFAECGLGKTPMQLEWARHVAKNTKGPVLILAPLAVAHQTVEEGDKFGIEAHQAFEDADIAPSHKIVVTNYDRLKKFDPARFTGVVLDESSILKSFTGQLKRLILEQFKNTPYKLACTATPAPNDHMELGNHSEFLAAMDSNEMLSRWFLNDTMKAGGYRLKKHAEKDYWRWVATWGVSIGKPSDIGHSDEGFILPPLNILQHTVYVDPTIGTEDTGLLIRKSDLSATTLHKEMRLTAGQRAAKVAELVNPSAEAWIVWCNTDYEADELAARIPDGVEVRGSYPIDRKEERLWDFAKGKIRVLITKPSIAGFGLNYQHCHNMAFVGLSYSYEQQYQAIRRSYRFGQQHPVNVHIVAADTEGKVADTVLRKQREHERMKTAMVEAMRDVQLSHTAARSLTAAQFNDMEFPEWLKTEV